MLKDRLYAEHPNGPDRRAAQFVLARLHDALTRLIAPILPHTAEELWAFVPDAPDKPESVHLAFLPQPDPSFAAPEEGEIDWTLLTGTREIVFRELEKLRTAKAIGSNQEAFVTVGSDDPAVLAVLNAYHDLMETNFIVSDVVVTAERPEGALDVPDRKLWFHVRRSDFPKCERCWNLRPTVGQDVEHPTLCERCARVVRSLPLAGA